MCIVVQAYDKARYGKTGEDESRLYNELEISVLRATGLPLGPDDAAPTAYVHFQFLGNPDKFTNPVQATRDPEFNERFVFPMMTNDQQLRLLSRSKLQLTVVDLNGEENADDADDAGLIGDIFVALNDVADGQSINDKFTLKSAAHGNPVGALQIAVRWRHPFRRQRELGPRSLSGLETETLIKAFSDGEVAAGLVNYRDFCRFIDPPRDVLRAIERLRAFATRMGEKEHRKPREIFKILLEKFDAMKVDTFVAKLLKVRDPFYLNTAACFADCRGVCIMRTPPFHTTAPTPHLPPTLNPLNISYRPRCRWTRRSVPTSCPSSSSTSTWTATASSPSPSSRPSSTSTTSRAFPPPCRSEPFPTAHPHHNSPGHILGPSSAPN
jgi:hypothetical protein